MSLTEAIRKVAAAAMLLSLPLSASAQENPLVPDPLQEEAETVSEAAPAAAPAEDGVHALTKTDVDAWLDGFMPYAITNAEIVGAVVTVVKDGEILTSRGFGYADLESRTPVDGYETIFRPGSVSKLFAWTAVMQLVEQGKIDLDEDVNAYLDFKIPDAFDKPITVRHLMTHTAGFEEVLRNLIAKDPDHLMSLGDYLKDSIPGRMFPPGEVPGYSNYGTALAGYIVERISGEPFADYIDNHIFQPLGMTHSTFEMPLPEKFKDDMSSGYENRADGKAGYYELIPASPAGALAASGADMGRFMIAHLNDGGPLLKPETARMMHETIDQHTPPLGAMVLGFYQQNRGDLRSIGHGGDTNFFHSDLSLFLDKDVGLFVSFNSSGTGGGTLMLREKLANEFALRYFPEAEIPFEPRLDTAKEHGALVVGVYESSRTSASNFAALARFLGQIKITMNEDDDLVVALGPLAMRWREVEPFVWRHTDGPERLAVKLGDDGKVEHLTFEPISPFMQLIPPPWYRSSALLTPLLTAALGALALTLVMWPVRAAVRWRYKHQFPLTGKEAMAYRLTRVAALLVFVFLGGWVFTFQTLFSDLSALGPDFDTQLYMTMSLQVLLYLAMALVLWNAFVVWGGKQSWLAKLWSALLPVAVLVVIFFSANADAMFER